MKKQNLISLDLSSPAHILRNSTSDIKVTGGDIYNRQPVELYESFSINSRGYDQRLLTTG